jgi:hypothetical protein
MRKRAVNLEGLADRLRLRVLAVELGRLPAFLRPAGPDRGGVEGDQPGSERPRLERVPPPRPRRPRSYCTGGRIASMVALIGR